jgi:hypothetical protein
MHLDLNIFIFISDILLYVQFFENYVLKELLIEINYYVTVAESQEKVLSSGYLFTGKVPATYPNFLFSLLTH